MEGPFLFQSIALIVRENWMTGKREPKNPSGEGASMISPGEASQASQD